MRSTIDWSRGSFYLFLLLMAIVSLVHNDAVSLWDQDEAAYAGFADRMIRTGDWLVPDFTWSEIHRKPPLHFWDIALCMKVFGHNAFAVRFPSVVYFLLTIVLIYRMGKTWLDEQRAMLAAVIFGTTLFVSSLAKISVTDATLLFFGSLAGWMIVRQLTQPHWRNVWWFWLAVAAGLLVKGPSILIFLGPFAVLVLIFHPKRWRLLTFHPWFFLPLAMAPLLWWGWLTWQRDDGAFVRWLVDWYVLKRVGGSVLKQSAPAGTHLLFILFTFLPYLVLVPTALKRVVKRVRERDPQYLVVSLWFVAAWLPWEFSPSKLPAYSVMAHVPLALLLAMSRRDEINPERKQPIVWAIIQGVLLGLIALGVPVALIVLEAPLYQVVLASGVSLVLLASQIMSLRLFWQRDRLSPLMWHNAIFLLLLWGVVYPMVDPVKNAPARVAEALKVDARDGAEVVVVGNHRGHPPSLIFYLEQLFANVRASQDPDTLRHYAADPSVSLVLNREQWTELFTQPPADSVCALLTDRKGRACYYLRHAQSTVSETQKPDR